MPGQAELVSAIRDAQQRDDVDRVRAAAYLRGVADGYARRDAAERVESVWSGPHHHAVPVRSTAQALVDLVAGAVDAAVLMTYSARPHPPVLDALCAARSRGAAVSVVVETLQGAAGALGAPSPRPRSWRCPASSCGTGRSRTAPDRSARMHAKIAVADRRALLVSSANLTQSGVDTNIEAGSWSAAARHRSGQRSTSSGWSPTARWRGCSWGSSRHPLSTTSSGCASEGAVAVGDVHSLVIEHALDQAVPEDLQPALPRARSALWWLFPAAIFGS